jgi:hypothetical protein
VDGGSLGGRAHRDAEVDVDVAQVAHGAGELELMGVLPQLLGAMEKLGAGGIAAGTAVVVRRVPVGGQADEEDASTASATSASRNQIFSRRSVPRARIHSASWLLVSAWSRITVSINVGLPARNSWPPDLGAVMAAAAMSLATWRTVSARSSS